MNKNLEYVKYKKVLAIILRKISKKKNTFLYT